MEIADSLKTQPGVDEATRTSRKVFLTMLAACLYCWLAILPTTDVQLLIGNSTVALPFVQTPIPVVAFFGAAPVLLLIIYLYLHFSLQNLWDALATLPAVFPDGRPVHERTLPWLLSPIPRLYFKRLAPFCPRLPKVQVRATALLMWWGVPFTLLAFSLRFLVRQDPVITRFRIPLITSIHVILVGISVWLSLMFWRITKDTLRGIAPRISKWYELRLSREALVGVLAGTLLAIFSAGCFYGRGGSIIYHDWNWRTTAPKLLSFLGWNAFGDLSGLDLSQKPDGWDRKDLDTVKGAQLRRRSLRNISAREAFGAKADFNGADLRNVDFGGADLRGAELGALLQGADFEDADLRGASLAWARGEAEFDGANIEGAYLGVNFEPRQIRRATNWPLAHFLPTQLRALGLCDRDPAKVCDYDDRLKRKDFSGIDFTRLNASFDKPDFSGAHLQHTTLPVSLRGADLSKADLRNAVFGNTDLSDANLTGADLRGADLRHVLGLTRGQIESALAAGATLPPYLDPETQKPFTPRK
jgi:uncharacterized protein YjbI with pentapeptide repeats